MSQPPGFLDKDKPSYVCKFRKAIYGLKQAPRAWYQEFRTFLMSYGFRTSVADPSLFMYNHNGTNIYLLVYVDDIIITGPSPTTLQDLLTRLAARFSLKDLGTLSYFLGVEVLPHTKGLFLSQKKYVEDLLGRANMTEAKPVSTPMVTHPPLNLTDGTPPLVPTDYRALVGSLQYLSLTRLDVAFAVNRLSQFMHKPTDLHWAALKRLLRYLKGTSDYGITLHRNSPLRLHAYSDADWAGDRDTYISTTGYIVYLGRNPLSWSSKKQQGLARSSTEAEFRAVASTTAEIIWLQSLLSELDIKLDHTPGIYCDNLSATHYSANPVFHSRMKHLALAFHFVREKVQLGALRVQHIFGSDQLADALTKPLAKTRFHDLFSKIGLARHQSILRGSVEDNTG